MRVNAGCLPIFHNLTYANGVASGAESLVVLSFVACKQFGSFRLRVLPYSISLWLYRCILIFRYLNLRPPSLRLFVVFARSSFSTGGAPRRRARARAKGRAKIFLEMTFLGAKDGLPQVATKAKLMTDNEFDPHDSYSEERAPRRISPKERELTRIKDRFARLISSYSTSGFEEDEVIERVNEAFDELIALAQSPSDEK